MAQRVPGGEALLEPGREDGKPGYCRGREAMGTGNGRPGAVLTIFPISLKSRSQFVFICLAI